MTEAEWPLFAAELAATFRGEFDLDHEAAMRAHVGRVPLDAAREAIAELVLTEQVFAPAPGELVAALRRRFGGWAAGRMLRGEGLVDRQDYELEQWRRRRMGLDSAAVRELPSAS